MGVCSPINACRGVSQWNILYYIGYWTWRRSPVQASLIHISSELQKMKLDITGPLVHLIRKLSIHIKMFGAENLFPSWHETIPVCGKWRSEHWRINLQLWAARQAGSHVSLQMVPPGKILSPQTKLQMCLQLSPSFPHLHEPAVDPEVGHTNTNTVRCINKLNLLQWVLSWPVTLTASTKTRKFLKGPFKNITLQVFPQEFSWSWNQVCTLPVCLHSPGVSYCLSH